MEEIIKWFMDEGNVIFAAQSIYNRIPSLECIHALEEWHEIQE